MNPTSPRIAVAGGGPGGLTLARVLQRQGFPVTVYDRDESATARPQGGSLDMHADTGQVALAAAGLLDDFLATARHEGQDQRLVGKDGVVLFEHEAGPDEQFNP